MKRIIVLLLPFFLLGCFTIRPFLPSWADEIRTDNKVRLPSSPVSLSTKTEAVTYNLYDGNRKYMYKVLSSGDYAGRVIYNKGDGPGWQIMPRLGVNYNTTRSGVYEKVPQVEMIAADGNRVFIKCQDGSLFFTSMSSDEVSFFLRKDPEYPNFKLPDWGVSWATTAIYFFYQTCVAEPVLTKVWTRHEFTLKDVVSIGVGYVGSRKNYKASYAADKRGPFHTYGDGLAFNGLFDVTGIVTYYAVQKIKAYTPEHVYVGDGVYFRYIDELSYFYNGQWGYIGKDNLFEPSEKPKGDYLSGSYLMGVTAPFEASYKQEFDGKWWNPVQYFTALPSPNVNITASREVLLASFGDNVLYSISWSHGCCDYAWHGRILPAGTDITTGMRLKRDMTILVKDTTGYVYQKYLDPANNTPPPANGSQVNFNHSWGHVGDANYDAWDVNDEY